MAKKHHTSREMDEIIMRDFSSPKHVSKRTAGKKAASVYAKGAKQRATGKVPWDQLSQDMQDRVAHNQGVFGTDYYTSGAFAAGQAGRVFDPETGEVAQANPSAYTTTAHTYYAQRQGKGTAHEKEPQKLAMLADIVLNHDGEVTQSNYVALGRAIATRYGKTYKIWYGAPYGTARINEVTVRPSKERNPQAYTTTATAMPFYQFARRESKLHPGRGAQEGLSRWLGTLHASKRAEVQQGLRDRRSVDAWHVGWSAGQKAYAVSGKARERQTVSRNPKRKAEIIHQPGDIVRFDGVAVGGVPSGMFDAEVVEWFSNRSEVAKTDNRGTHYDRNGRHLIPHHTLKNTRTGKVFVAPSFAVRERQTVVRNPTDWRKDGLTDLHRQGFMRSAFAAKKTKTVPWFVVVWRDGSGIMDFSNKLSAESNAQSLGGDVITIKAKVDSKTGALVDRVWSKAAEKKLDTLMGRKSNPGKSTAAAALYENFHGVPSTETLEIPTKVFHQADLAALGDLAELQVQPAYGKQRNKVIKLDFSTCKVKLAANPAANTLYFVGGDQSLPLAELGLDKPAYTKDNMLIGTVHELTYSTRKKFDNLQQIDYYHGLGEVSKECPVLMYNPITKQLAMVGGAYEIKDVGIVN